jgi:deoxycytidine triphosphate deaminase
MVLVDHEIAKRVNYDGLIDSFDPSCLTNIGYDLRAKYFVVSNNQKETHESVTLQPNESAFVATAEDIRMPTDLLAQVVLKNSRIRLGLSLDAPVYQPGHHTKVFFRLTNVSADSITLYAGDKYATVIFHQLVSVPDRPYNGAFSNEFDFNGLGYYKDIYKNQIRELEKKADDVKAIENTIYTNVLTILTVFVALFSFLTTNIALTANSATIEQYFIFNALLLGCISFLVALLKTIVTPTKCSWKLWAPAFVAFVVAFLLFYN